MGTRKTYRALGHGLTSRIIGLSNTDRRGVVSVEVCRTQDGSRFFSLGNDLLIRVNSGASISSDGQCPQQYLSLAERQN